MRRRRSLTKEGEKSTSFQNTGGDERDYENVKRPVHPVHTLPTNPESSMNILDNSSFIDYSGSRFGYINGKLPKAKSSNINLMKVASNASFAETFVSTDRATIGLTRPSLKAKPKSFSFSRRITTLATITVVTIISLLTISTASKFLVDKSLLPSKKHNHKHKKDSHDKYIKLSPQHISESSSLKKNKPVQEKRSQNVNLRAASYNDERNIHGGMSHKNSQMNEDRQNYLDGTEKEDSIEMKEQNYDRIMPMNVATDFFFATSSKEFKLGGYGQLPFPIYCPIVPEKYSNQAIEYINTCEYEYIAWCASLWIYPKYKVNDEEIAQKKRIIFSDSVLKLFLNSDSQLVLECIFSASNLTLSTELSVKENEWSHIGVSVVPINNYHENRIKIRLYMHGKELASTETVPEKFDSSGIIDTSRLGQDELDNHSFEGHMGMLAIWTKSSESAIFRDDFIMKSAYRAGLHTKDIASLEQSGLVKSPDFLFSLRIPPLDTVETGKIIRFDFLQRFVKYNLFSFLC